MSRNQYVFAASINSTDILESILGDIVLENAWVSFVNAIEPQIKSLFARYTNISEVTYTDYSFFMFVSAPKDDVMFDIQEQKTVLIPLAQQYFREMFVAHFGGSSGRKIDFSLLYTSVVHSEQFTVNTIQEAIAIEGISDALLVESFDKQVSPYCDITRQAFKQILDNQELQTYVQSIVNLQDDSIAGYEILTRGPKGSTVERADKLFGSASHFGLTREIEFACARQALTFLPYVPNNQFLTINVGPDVLASDELLALLQASEIRPFHRQLAFELTEHLPLDDLGKVTVAVKRLQNLGIQVLLDDTGCGFFDISTAEVLRPAIVKLCITVIRRIELGDVIEKEITSTRQRLDELNINTLGEGVEETFQADTLKRAGVQYAQGYYFDIPQPIEHVLKLTKG
ncbi:EAL domain-containing protein [uncultured Paraglaciecola sp.]|uniref:EAL domain-containing protein n=1 Tax=uncultured Paraglaciecola sp. TaxID=1765024 RepID=UPI0030D98153|tara:strand:+ start:5651 stop:6850 length:1200 start_codon:yes stop_codon:yes gene_type:complete